MPVKVILIPGNGNSSVQDNWFPSVKASLEQKGIQVVAEDFPDPDLARESYWIPHLRDKLKADENTVLVGHSSGAIAALRYAESTPILGSILVGAYYTDLGMETEKQSGYFSREWNWDNIRKHQKFITIFASTDDPWIPIEEARYLHKQLHCEYHEYTHQGHFGGDYFKESFPELTLSLMQNLEKCKNLRHA